MTITPVHRFYKLAYKGHKYMLKIGAFSFLSVSGETQIIEWECCLASSIHEFVHSRGRGNIGLGKGRLYKSRTKVIIRLTISAASFLYSHSYSTVQTPGICDLLMLFTDIRFSFTWDIDDWTPRFSNFSQWVDLNDVTT